MELKRFVLLNGYNLILDSKNEEELRVVHYADGDVLKVVVDNWYYPLEKLDYKTSNNILDFVEVGDLVGYRFWGEDYENIDKMRDEQNIKNDIKYNGNGFVIVAIYKRQTNGDYKRYEVKEN